MAHEPLDYSDAYSIGSNRQASHYWTNVKTVVRCLTTGIRSEKWVVMRFRRCANVTVYLHKPWNVALTWPLNVWKFFQASVSRRGRFQPYWRFAMVSNFPPQSAYLEFPKILTIVVYAVRRWTKHLYAAHYPSVLRGRTTGYQFRLAFTQKYFEPISLQIVSLSILWRCAFRQSPTILA